MAKTMRCQACGQGWEIIPTDVFTTRPIAFCPACGADTLKRDASEQPFKARCFADVHPILLQSLYEAWRLKEGEFVKAPTFLAYIYVAMRESD